MRAFSESIENSYFVRELQAVPSGFHGKLTH